MKISEKSSSTKSATPLWVISLFVSLTEVITGVAATQITGNLQEALIVFVIAFPLFIASAFFIILWHKPYVFYPPTEFKGVDVNEFVEAMQRKRDIGTVAIDVFPEVIEEGAKEYKSQPEELVAFVEDQLKKLPNFKEVETTEAQPKLYQRSILWVDDKPMNNVYESSVFKQLGASIVFARSTTEAINFINQDNYDLVISDINRDEDGQSNPNAGYELLEKLRSMGNTNPLVFYTGNVRYLDKQRSKDAFGAADKPIGLIDSVIRAVS
jgi:CheY-like chemotaxis protein